MRTINSYYFGKQYNDIRRLEAIHKKWQLENDPCMKECKDRCGGCVLSCEKKKRYIEEEKKQREIDKKNIFEDRQCLKWSFGCG